MILNNNLQAGFLCVLIISAIVTSSTGGKHSIGNLRKNAKVHFLQIKSMPAGSVSLACKRDTYETIKTNDVFDEIRITLKRNQPVTSLALMQYLNFGIGSCFYAVCNQDTFACAQCDRIPGISSEEFVYLAHFSIPPAFNSNNLRLCIDDTLAGFGKCSFTFNNLPLKN